MILRGEVEWLLKLHTRYKQLTYTSWNNREEKFDLRSWNEDHTAMTKGITLTKEEALKLRDILNEIDFDEL